MMINHSILVEYWGLLSTGTLDTLYMTFISTFFAYLFGLPMGIALVTTEERHILPNRAASVVLGWIVNIGRSIPFIILLIAIIPFTHRWRDI